MGIDKQKLPFVEHMEVTGRDLVGKLQDLVQDSSAKRVIVRDQHGKQLLALPLNAGLAVGAVVGLVQPVLLILGGAAGYAAKLRLEVERDAGSEVVESSVVTPATDGTEPLHTTTTDASDHITPDDITPNHTTPAETTPDGTPSEGGWRPVA